MRRLAILFIVIAMLFVASSSWAATLPLEANVPDAAALHITSGGFGFLSTAATTLFAGFDLTSMLMAMNPILDIDCTNLLFLYVQMQANFTQVNLDNRGVQVDTNQLMGLDYVPDAIYLRLWMSPTDSLPMLRLDFTGLQGSSGCTDPLDAYAELTIDPLEVGASVTMEYNPLAKGFTVTIHQVLVNMTNLTVNLQGFPAGLDTWVQELLQTMVPQLIEQLAPTLINQLLDDQLGNIHLEGDMPVGDFTLHYGFTPQFATDSSGLTATTDGSLYIAGTTIDPCIGNGYTGSPYTDNPLPTFGPLTPGGNPYHFGLALSDDILNQLLFSFVAKGALCLMFPWDLTLGAFEGMTDGWRPPGKYEDAANMIDLYPLDTPQFVVGEGDSDLALLIQPYRLDWYIQKEQRYVDMLSAEIYINLSLSMDTDQDNNLIITLEGTDITFDVTGSEFNVLPPDVIEGLINGIITFFLPQIVDLIPPIPLPNWLGYQFAIDEVGAVGSGNDYFGLYCEFQSATAKGPAVGFRLPVFGVATHRALDAAASARVGLAATPHPRLTLTALNPAARVDHYLVRVDGAAWQRVLGDTFDLTWLLEGRHTVEALAVAPHGVASGEPAWLSFVLDRVPPRIDRAHLSPEMILTLAAHDYVAAANTLLYQIRLLGGDWSTPFTATTVRLAVPPGTKAIEVRALDPAGNATAPLYVAVTVTPPVMREFRR